MGIWGKMWGLGISGSWFGPWSLPRGLQEAAGWPHRVALRTEMGWVAFSREANPPAGQGQGQWSQAQ